LICATKNYCQSGLKHATNQLLLLEGTVLLDLLYLVIALAAIAVAACAAIAVRSHRRMWHAHGDVLEQIRKGGPV